MTKFGKILIGALLATVVGAAGLALAANTGSNFYFGFNPSTGYNGQQGVPYAGGPVPTLSGAGCGTLATVQASEVGGSSVFQFTANATSCTITVTVPVAPNATAAAPANNGIFCVAADETTPADSMRQSAHTTTSCTITGTVVSGDAILVEINGF